MVDAGIGIGILILVIILVGLCVPHDEGIDWNDMDRWMDKLDADIAEFESSHEVPPGVVFNRPMTRYEAAPNTAEFVQQSAKTYNDRWQSFRKGETKPFHYLEKEPAADAPVSDNPSGLMCKVCRSVGMLHCAEPEWCGGMTRMKEETK